MPEIFSKWQAEYAVRGLPTFPIDPIADGGKTKRPNIKHYDKIGLKGSQQLALKFRDTNGLACMAGARNGLTLVDIDARGAEADRLMADVQCLYGRSRFITRTGRGGLHAYYRYNGEARKIRPNPSTPIDILGGGVVVLPPSLGAEQPYEIIEGHLDDLTALTRIKHAPTPTPKAPISTEPLHLVQEGERDKNFWPYVAQVAHQARSIDDLVKIATELNSMLRQPLTQTEIAAKTKYWWEKTLSGKNRFGTGGFVITDHAVIDGLYQADNDAFNLLIFLQRHNWGRDFALANETCALMPGGGWGRKRLAAARARLIEAGHLKVIRPATMRRPMICRLCHDRDRNRERGREPGQRNKEEGCISSYWWSQTATLNSAPQHELSRRKRGSPNKGATIEQPGARTPIVLIAPHVRHDGFGLAFNPASPPDWVLHMRACAAAVEAGKFGVPSVPRSPSRRVA